MNSDPAAVRRRYLAARLVAGIATGMLLVGVTAASASPRGVASLAAVDRVAVSGPRVAYADITRSAGWDVFVRDTMAGRTHRIGGAGDQLSADIDGTIVVFADFADGGSDIRGFDLLERRAFDICTQPGNQARPRVSGDWVVWSELGIGSTGSVVALDLRTSEQVVVADRLACNAEIAGTIVVFEDHSSGAPVVRVFDLAEKRVSALPSAGAENLMPVTDGESVAWVVPGRDGYDVAYRRLDAGSTTVVDRAGEQTLPAIDGGRLSFSERVDGGAVRVATLDVATGSVRTMAGDADVVAFDAGAGATALVSRGGSDRWALAADLPAVSPVDRLATAVRAAWRAIAPARYLAWAPDAPTFSANGAEQAAALLRPTMVSARVGGQGRVTVRWESPRSLAGVKDFDVYRSARPIEPGKLSAAKRLASHVETTTYVDDVAKSSDTTLQASAYYYAVIARDRKGELSPLSASISANPHGAGVYTVAGVESCRVCHAVHGSSEASQGALGARSADRCYDCHGSTTTTDTAGAGSFFDTQARFRDDATNTAGPVLKTGGSIHRNATMVQRQRECTACHDAHARPYAVDASGRYDKAASASKLLRTQVAAKGTSVAWSDADPAGNRVCFACHGTTMTPISIAGGSAAYARSGGDHLGSGDRTYTRSAHASIPASGSAAAVQCLVCHNQHGSATARLVDYRQSNTTDPMANRQANLCYRCHNSTTPSTWNGRDVRAEFGRASRHPALATTGTAGPSATCVSCHNTHFVQTGSGVWDAARVSDPLGTADGVSGTTIFCLRCHAETRADGGVTIGAVASASRLVPYEVRMRPTGLWPYFTGWGKADEGAEYAKSGHATASTAEGRAGCETCHDPHASDFSALTAWTRPAGALIAGGLTGERANTAAFADRSKEENLCFQCHGDGSGGTGKAAGAPDVLSSTRDGYAHPIATSDAHRNTESATDLATSRHAECVDCHDPHAARPGTHKPDSSTAGEALRGAVGVKPAWSGDSWSEVVSLSPKRLLPGNGDDFEAYLCFKCHSGPTETGTAGSAGFRTDLAREFNPANLSYHRVLGASQSGVRDEFTVTAAGSGPRMAVDWPLPTANVFKPGVDRDTMMTCSSCHGSSRPGEAGGPHGSSSKYLLDPEFPVDWDSSSARLTKSSPGMPDGLVCSKCHSLTDGAGRWGNNVHAEHAARGGSAATCRACHAGVPHGWKRPRLLAYTTDEFPYNTWKSGTGLGSTGGWGLTRVKVKATTSPQGWVASDCYAGCHEVHSTPVRSYWP